MSYQFTEQQLREAISKSVNRRQALRLLGFSNPNIYNYIINDAVRQYEIDISHFSGRRPEPKSRIKKCFVCDNLTKNPKFCSHSCAAASNNRSRRGPYRHNYTKEEVEDAAKNSVSNRSLARSLGISENYVYVVKELLVRYNINTDHFSRQAHNKGKKFPERSKARRTPIENVLVENSRYPTDLLRKRLLSEGLMKYICTSCNLAEWLDKPIPLELDHINGVSNDHRLHNLRLLCPNCHAKTPTYRGRNKKKLRTTGFEPVM